MNKLFLPLFVDLENKNVLIVGGGNVAFRKAKTFLRYGANVTVITKDRRADFSNLEKTFNNLKIYENTFFSETMLEKVFLVVTATDDVSENDRIVKLCKNANVLVNNASSKLNLDVRMCSIYEDDECQIGISAYGNPNKSKQLREKIKFLLKGEDNMKRVISTPNAPSAIGPYSQAIEANGVLYVSGQVPFVPETMEIVEGGVEAQTKQSLENVGAILRGAGYDFKDVVKATVFIKDMNDFAKINAVYSEYLGEVKPARACVEVARLPKDVLVEIEVIATK